MAETEVFQVRWSEKILEEAERNVKRKRPDAAAISRRFQHIRRSFPEAMVTGYEALESAMANDPKDRHVLAAAVVGRADVIVTFNLGDFPSGACEPYDIDVQHPDEFLCNQWDLDEELMADAMERRLGDYESPPLSLEQLLQNLERDTPSFCEVVRSSGLG